MRSVAAAVVLLALLAVAGCGDEEPPAEPTSSEMARLLEEAASCPAVPLRRLVRLGGKLGPDPNDDIPFTPMLLMTRLGPEGDAHLQPLGPADTVTCERILAALEAGRPVQKRERLSALRTDFITRIDMHAASNGVRGVVRFQLGDFLAGDVQFTALRVEGAWRVVEFRLPLDGLKTTRQRDGRWLLEYIQTPR